MRLALVLILAALGCRPVDPPAIPDFARWPGKGVALKFEIELGPADFPELKGFAVKGDDTTDRRHPFRTTERRLWFVSGGETVIIILETARGSAYEAQQALVNKEMLTSLPEPERFTKLGWWIGLDIGDVCLVPIGLTPERIPELTVLDFVRHNVRVEVRVSDARLLLPLCRRIDFRLRSEPTVLRC